MNKQLYDIAFRSLLENKEIDTMLTKNEDGSININILKDKGDNNREVTQSFHLTIAEREK